MYVDRRVLNYANPYWYVFICETNFRNHDAFYFLLFLIRFSKTRDDMTLSTIFHESGTIYFAVKFGPALVPGKKTQI